MDSQKRLEVLSRQLTSAVLSSQGVKDLEFCPKELNKFIVHDNYELREKMFEFLKDPLYRPDYKMDFMDFRQQTLDRLKKFVSQNFFHLSDYINDPRRFMAALEVLAFCDYSLAIKAGVHFTLCGGTILRLGTGRHHQKYVNLVSDLSLPGCFAMTELAHGSNVMGIETTATYDAATQEFVIDTPNDQATKYWIGGSGQHAKVTVCFAQLTVGGEWRGPHVFVVRLRDDAGNIMPGIRITDHGAKQGLNGVDNGRIWFHNVRVPREDLLNAFADVSPDGKYTSPIASPAARFGTMVSGLTTGRVLVAAAAIDAAKIGLTIAIRYSAAREQFGDKPILEYLTHQDRLFPHLASVYAQHFALGQLKVLHVQKRPEDQKLVHVVSSGLKAAGTWGRLAALQQCRECCGGMGFLSQNKIGPLINDMNVDVTFEGDNTVLMQQVAKTLLEDKALTAAAPTAPAAVPNFPVSYLIQLLRFREHLLTRQVAAEATANGAGDKAAALERNQDIGVQIGWASIERYCLEAFVAASNDPRAGGAGNALRLLARLYGLTRVRDSLATYLAAGAVPREDAARLRTEIVRVYGILGAQNAALAKRLCDGFGIPDHLLQAPIAFDWKSQVQ